MAVFHGDASLDVDIGSYESTDGCFGGAHHRADERVGGTVENQREGDLAAVDADVVFHHFVFNKVLAVAGIADGLQCVEDEVWV